MLPCTRNQYEIMTDALKAAPKQLERILAAKPGTAIREREESFRERIAYLEDWVATHEPVENDAEYLAGIEREVRPCTQEEYDDAKAALGRACGRLERGLAAGALQEEEDALRKHIEYLEGWLSIHCPGNDEKGGV